jgi:hypothetical protein
MELYAFMCNIYDNDDDIYILRSFLHKVLMSGSLNKQVDGWRRLEIFSKKLFAKLNEINNDEKICGVPRKFCTILTRSLCNHV